MISRASNCLWLLSIPVGLLLFSACMLLFWPWNLDGTSQSILITIHHGLTPAEIARLLKQNRIIQSENGFLTSARMLGWSRSLKAGRYRFKGRVNNFSILTDLSRGRAFLEKITFPEGIRATRIAGILQKQLGVDSLHAIRLIGDKNFCRSLNVEANSLEGYLYPDTYFFQTNESPETVLKRMVVHFHEIFSDSLRKKASVQGLTVHETVTLASLVEGEAVLDSERPIIAAIYRNRLRNGFPLQACPTVQYLLPDGPRRLLDKDLTIDSPYNTYLYPGLPPGPVNNPSIRSFQAVLEPAAVRYLYLVANGDGSHTFSNTLDEHNNAKRRFNQVRHQVYSR